MLSTSIRMLAAVGAILALCSLSRAQLQIENFGQGDMGGPPVVLVPCTAGGTDFSLTTGCNIPFFVGGVFP